MLACGHLRTLNQRCKRPGHCVDMASVRDAMITKHGSLAVLCQERYVPIYWPRYWLRPID